MMASTLKTAFNKQLNKGKTNLALKKYDQAFYYFENAHILGQKHVYRHVVSHYWILVYGFKTNNTKEVMGQVLRIVVATIFTLIWVPKGNTGGARVSAVKELPIRKELQKYF